MEQGLIEISRDGQILEYISIREIVGEMALVEDEETWSADAIAASIKTLVPINRRRFRELV